MILFLTVSLDVLKGIGIMRWLVMRLPYHVATCTIPRFSLQRARELRMSSGHRHNLRRLTLRIEINLILEDLIFKERYYFLSTQR